MPQRHLDAGPERPQDLSHPVWASLATVASFSPLETDFSTWPRGPRHYPSSHPVVPARRERCVFCLFVCFTETGESDTSSLFRLVIHSLVAPCVRSDWGQTLKPGVSE